MNEVFITFFLSLVLMAFIGLFIYYMEKQKQTHDKLINALIAKKPEEFRDLNLADKVQPIKPQDQKPPDMIPLDQLSDEDFDAHIQEELAN